MIRTVAHKEFLLSITTIRFSVLVLICCLLMPVSVWVLSSDVVREHDDYEGRVDLEERRQAGKDASINVSRPVPQLAGLFRGVSLEAVNTVNLKYLIGWNRPIAAEAQSDTHAVFPSVDLSFIIGMVFSVMALMLSYDALSGEREQATLRLMMSAPLTRSSVVIGKWLGLSLVMIVPMMLGVIISLLVFFLATGVALSAGNWAALALAILICIIYVSVFVLLGITISSLTRSTTQSIFTCLVVWGVVTLIIPQLANVASEIIVALPSTQVKEKNIRVAHNEFCEDMRSRNMAIAEQAIAEKWPYTRVQQSRRQNQIKSSLEAIRTMNAIVEESWLQVAKQENTGKIIASLSPYGALNTALIALADTGPESQRTFLRAAYRYGEAYFDQLANDNSDRPASEVIASIPKFSFNETSFDQRLALATLPAAALIITNILLLLVAVIAFNRYDVR